MEVAKTNVGSIVENMVSGTIYMIDKVIPEGAIGVRVEDRMPVENPTEDDLATITEVNEKCYTLLKSGSQEKEYNVTVENNNIIVDGKIVPMGELTAEKIIESFPGSVIFIGERNGQRGLFSYKIRTDKFNLIRPMGREDYCQTLTNGGDYMFALYYVEDAVIETPDKDDPNAPVDCEFVSKVKSVELVFIKSSTLAEDWAILLEGKDITDISKIADNRGNTYFVATIRTPIMRGTEDEVNNKCYEEDVKVLIVDAANKCRYTLDDIGDYKINDIAKTVGKHDSYLNLILMNQYGYKFKALYPIRNGEDLISDVYNPIISEELIRKGYRYLLKVEDRGSAQMYTFADKNALAIKTLKVGITEDRGNCYSIA